MELDLTSGGSAPAPDLIQDGDVSNFAALVVNASMETPVIVDFWADWCGPCKQLTPILEKIVIQAAGAVKLVKVNADENQALAQQLRVQSLPTVMAFKNGQPVDGFMGAVPESQVKDFVEKLVGDIGLSPVEQVLEQAEAAIAEGQYEAASRALMQAVQVEPNNGRAIAGLVNCLIGLEDLEGAGQVLEQAPAEASGPELDRARAALELAEQASNTGDLQPLKEAVEKNPNDHQARFDLAIALNAAGAREEAVDELLTIFAADKEWNDQAARKQLLTFFEAYGPTDEVTLNGRRRLSSLLFS